MMTGTASPIVKTFAVKGRCARRIVCASVGGERQRARVVAVQEVRRQRAVQRLADQSQADQLRVDQLRADQQRVVQQRVDQ